jgi:hypothetical protein|tara:strand:- start:18196 stop:18537 length:342 start_codon:yes stop_codon:yes gene_type:complete
MNDIYLKIYNTYTGSYIGMLNASKVQSMVKNNYSASVEQTTILIELDGETSGFTAILLVDNIVSGGSIWPTEAEGTEMFLKMLAKAQRSAIHGSNTLVDFYPPQGVTVSSWTA